MNLHTHDYLAYRVKEVVIILDLGAMNVDSLFVLSYHPRSTLVQSCNDVMDLKSLLAVNSKCSPCLTCFQSVFTKTSCCRGATLGKSLSFFGFNVVQP
jgi:bacterioferritin-associated ferredoxin